MTIRRRSPSGPVLFIVARGRRRTMTKGRFKINTAYGFAALILFSVFFFSSGRITARTDSYGLAAHFCANVRIYYFRRIKNIKHRPQNETYELLLLFVLSRAHVRVLLLLLLFTAPTSTRKTAATEIYVSTTYCKLSFFVAFKLENAFGKLTV